jgi:hypothetical protein
VWESDYVQVCKNVSDSRARRVSALRQWEYPPACAMCTIALVIVTIEILCGNGVSRNEANDVRFQ